MGSEFITDPLDHVKPGDIVRIRVISVDIERKRIGFSMKTDTIKKDKPKKIEMQSDIVVKQSHKKPARSLANKTSRKKSTSPKQQKIGSFGELLAQAGIKNLNQ